MIKTINPSSKTPLVIADTLEGEISISGVIIPENPVPFFNELMEITLESNKLANNLSIIFDLEYFNTGAARYIYDYLKKTKNLTGIKITWFYQTDDEDIFESGQEFQAMTGLQFNFVIK